MMDLQSILGYSKGSPFAGNPYLDIHTPEGLIDMSNTEMDLIGIDNKGNKKKMKAGSKNPYKFEGDVVREIPTGNIYAKGGNVYDFLFGDDEDDAPVTAPSTEEVEQASPQQEYTQDTSEYDMTLAMAMETYSHVASDPFANRKQYQSLPHGAVEENEKEIIQEAASRYGVPSQLLYGVYGAETSFGKNINTSSAGAQGPFQFMPGTAREYGVDVNDFGSSANGAAKYLKNLYDQFGDWEKAVAAYNAGSGNIKKGRYPKETQNYVPKVFGYANSFK